MNLTRLKSALAWQTTKGRELVRLDEGAIQATVIASACDESELRALAEACNDAANQIRDYKNDSAPLARAGFASFGLLVPLAAVALLAAFGWLGGGSDLAECLAALPN